MFVTVKAARITSGIPAEEMAFRLGLSKTGYLRKENGKTRFYVDEIAKISLILGISIENFLELSCHLETQKAQDYSAS
ncbi:helix-turn-helix domain-containing protein [Paenibacillus popilliae]|uniref:Predicted transcriptional regulator n=1 Tax=Paenibacillus popilliae ATCC 14706 TaxID=1212764 RepID=M9LZH5_PAEPP|nr:helix-turn-helix transcriptional regulator [Paenibacillus popilliae]GAC41684.1 predicted transcriptional regulator [Paenibacillus popilliae ATCC 14706]